ncbi:UNVERIFIED_CONTAM: hypothetical protein FKN15_076453 [Acipenser sinensis]
MAYEAHTFETLRDTAVCRLTLFNARRGGAPSRMLLTEWEDAEKDSWIDKNQVKCLDDPFEKALINRLKGTYQTGKGNNHLLPVLIPLDTIDAMKRLADKEIRELAGVAKDNPYFFANTNKSDNHVGGWHALHGVALKADVQHVERLTATKMRHKISTLYAALEVPESESNIFYKHMGHSEDINKNIYQSPMALLEVTKVGRHLQNFDSGQI